jgi:hypothetical protein
MENQKENTTYGVELLTALANFQNEAPIIPKNKKGYGYNYAELSKTVEILKPFLKKYNLGFTQLLENENDLITIVFHYPSAQLIKCTTVLPKGYELKGMNLFQTDGARNTYYKRYVLLGILGVFSEDEDTDAKGKAEKVNENKTEEKPKLNSNQFIQLIGYIKTGKISIAQAVKKYNLSEEQKISLENIE